ncbi:hypothetical protein RFY41_03795, partial [Acinetobacter soli]|uniref:hypothetical protein n=1 Tax=Acinetobacter soli TaxID=487316 RepID=UPI0028140DEF
LWFIPTFHNITKLSPFLGALCVLSVLWIVNEIFNRNGETATFSFNIPWPCIRAEILLFLGIYALTYIRSLW